MTFRQTMCILLLAVCATQARAGVFEVQINGVRPPLPPSNPHPHHETVVPSPPGRTAISLLRQKAQAGDKAAMQQLAWFYATTNDGKSDSGQAVYWYTVLAEKGDVIACRFLSEYYGTPGPHLDLARAEPLHVCLANAGDTNAMKTLVALYEADGPFKDNAKALAWTIKLAENGDGAATSALCQTPEDAPTYRQAMETCGHSWRRTPADDETWGIATFEGRGVPRDTTAALPALLNAMLSGQVRAADYVGRYIEDNLVTPAEADTLRYKMWLAAFRGYTAPREWLDSHPAPAATAGELDVTQIPRGYIVLTPNGTQRPLADALYQQWQTSGTGLYPAGATANEIEGIVELSCVWSDTGTMSTCDVLKESPLGYDFAAESIRLVTSEPLHVQPADGWRTLSASKRTVIRLIWTLQ